MYMMDFVYANKRLSDFGCMVANIVTQRQDNISLNSNLSFETLKNSSTFVNGIVKVNYENPSPVTFDICKKGCDKNNSFSDANTFNDKEISFFMSWLNKKNNEKFFPIYNDSSYPDIYFKGYFNLSAISIGGNIIGFTLTFNQNSPFGYENDKEFLVDINNPNETFTFFNDSDEYGYLYPSNLIIKCKDKGNLVIKNSLDSNYPTVVKNCEKGETITFDCANKIIKSDYSHPRLFADFNYNYPRFVLQEDNNQNDFTVSIPCEIKILYSLIRKVGVIV